MPSVAARLNARLTALTACLCAELTPDDAEEPFMCMCQRIPGVFPGETYSGEGEDMAWVRVAQIYPSGKVGEASQQTGNIKTGIGFDVELGVMRCFEVNDDSTYDLDILANLANVVITDWQAMARAISCCTGPAEDPWTATDWIVGPWTPLGPAGAMTGGTITVYMGL